ncbi:lipoprotein [Geobacillus stearothermophilus]|uniref:lipoprotein n=1 Tax=Geobacillus stearothermophilus TaxID=1422 RepID=UPI003D1BE3A3
MKLKLIPFVVLLIITILLTGCNEEKNKKKYDLAINQVITLENKYLQKEKIFSDTQILKREDTGIIVFKDGKFIELIYDVSGKQIESLYKRDIDNNYKRYPNTKEELEKVDKDLKIIDYTENIGLK